MDLSSTTRNMGFLFIFLLSLVFFIVFRASILMIGPGGLLLVVPIYMHFQLEVAKKTAILQHFNFIIENDILSHLTDSIHHSGPHFGHNLTTQPTEREPVTTCTVGWPT
jgi:hypothetical protein